MIQQSGYKYVTDAESLFVFNIMSKFKPNLNVSAFEEWASSIVNRNKKTLIQYSEYLDTVNMRMRTDQEVAARREAKSSFLKKFQVADGGLSLSMPDSIKLLVCEVADLGDKFFAKTLKKYSIGGGNQDDVIEFNSFVDMLTVYKYYCSNFDCNELKFWMFNHGLISLSSENHLKKDTFYINCRTLISTLKKIQESKGLKTTNSGVTLQETYDSVSNHIVRR